MRFRFALIALVFGSLLSSCSKDPDSNSQTSILIDTTNRFDSSTLAGNLMATALKQQTAADIVFYPSEFLMADKYAVIDDDLTGDMIDNQILPLYDTAGQKDQFQVGTLKGSTIRRFVLNRTLENYRLDLQTAGLEYDIQFIGGLPTIYQINLSHGIPLVDDQYYRVVFSDFKYSDFPGYKYRNGLEQAFRPEEKLVSSKDSLKKFLSEFKRLPLLDEPRAGIRVRTRGVYPEALTVEQIQGISHLSPFMGYQVATSGIITAISKPDEIDGMEVFIQMPDGTGDTDPRTSRALNVALATKRSDLAVGQEIEVLGMVSEVMTFQGMTRTSIQNVDSIRILNKTPVEVKAVLLGNGISGLKIPNEVVSTYRGNLNQKKELNLDEGIDFWESLEGMRVEVPRPTVLGFRGGFTKNDEARSSYITIYVKPDGVSKPELTTSKDGLMSDVMANRFNPEIIRIVDSNIAPNVKTDMLFEAGQKFSYNLTGVIGFQTNTFGDGEFVFYVTSMFNEIGSYNEVTPANEALTAKQRRLDNYNKLFKSTRLLPDEDHLTVASFNVENLAGNRTARIKAVGESFGKYLGCPDILVIPEIQDFNGPDMAGGSSAEQTLINLMGEMPCADKPYYRALNIDPVPMQDGGEPGGNIRVAMIFNSRRVTFEPKGTATALDETTIDDQGRLNQNPGRLYPNDPVFERSRKPLVAEFIFKGQRIVIIGNHFNSKLGDGNLWGAEQPLDFGSEVERSLIASRVHQFAARLMAKDPSANVIIAGDLNAYWNENSLKILAGSQFTNLMTHKDLVPRNDWFTSNYNGSTGAIDHMFVNDKFLAREPEFEIVHLNSIFMNHLSDHDPIIGRFKF